MSKKIRSSYSLSEKSIEYIEEYKANNAISSKALALDKIIKEHKSKSNVSIEITAKLIANEISKIFKDDVNKSKISSRETDKNVQIMLEMMNGYMLQEFKKEIATTTGLTTLKAISPAYRIAKEEVEKKIHKRRIKRIDDINE